MSFAANHLGFIEPLLSNSCCMWGIIQPIINNMFLRGLSGIQTPLYSYLSWHIDTSCTWTLWWVHLLNQIMFVLSIFLEIFASFLQGLNLWSPTICRYSPLTSHQQVIAPQAQHWPAQDSPFNWTRPWLLLQFSSLQYESTHSLQL